MLYFPTAASEEKFMPRFLVLLLALFIGGCTSVEFNPAPGAPSYGAYKGEVKLLDRLPPPGRYKRLGIVIARGPRVTDAEDLVEDLKTEAAKRGADAIVLQSDVKISSVPGGYIEKSLGAFALRLKP
jgi:hypothetical protein